MIELKDFGHSASEECLALVKAFVQIEDPELREAVLLMMEDLANETGSLWRLIDGEFVTFF